MIKYQGTKYNSMMDSSAWTILLLVCVMCIIPIVADPKWWLILTMGIIILFILLTFIGIYYKIDGNNLVVYQFFIPTAYPINLISEIKPTKTILSAPATSLNHRLAIKFTDRKVLKSYMPLVISPVRQKEFICQLIAINPKIQH